MGVMLLRFLIFLVRDADRFNGSTFLGKAQRRVAGNSASVLSLSVNQDSILWPLFQVPHTSYVEAVALHVVVTVTVT